MVRWFDSLHLCLALVPLVIYLLVLGWLNLRRRGTIVSGFSDALLLGFAVCGLVIVGPMELFFPEMAAFRMGPWVWLLLLGLYALLVVLLGLSQRPRLIFYNIDLDTAQRLTIEAASPIDAEVQQLEDCLVLPQQRLQLHLHRSPVFRNVQLTALGEEHNLIAWNGLRRNLQQSPPQRTTPTRAGYAMLALALLLMVSLAALSVADHQEIARGFGELLRRE
ncbi:MAG: hypothetical protein AAGF97_12250 [Planctomycetota bacterium]